MSLGICWLEAMSSLLLWRPRKTMGSSLAEWLFSATKVAEMRYAQSTAQAGRIAAILGYAGLPELIGLATLR